MTKKNSVKKKKNLTFIMITTPINKNFQLLLHLD